MSFLNRLLNGLSRPHWLDADEEPDSAPAPVKVPAKHRVSSDQRVEDFADQLDAGDTLPVRLIDPQGVEVDVVLLSCHRPGAGGDPFVFGALRKKKMIWVRMQ